MSEITKIEREKGDQFYKTVVYAEDMADNALETVIQISKEAFQSQVVSGKVYTAVASYIRSKVEKEFGTRGWSCVVGDQFGAHVTHEIKTYAYFRVVHGVSVLIWKS